VSSHEDRDRPVRTPAALWRVIDGRAVIFHEETGRAFTLNETATRIWELCDGRASLGELCRLAGESGRESVERLLDQLVDEGFVVMEEAGDVPPVAGEAGQPPPADGEWAPAAAEDIRFAACDCTGAAYGSMRNLECLLVSPGQAS
jgi:hypothetical protein